MNKQDPREIIIQILDIVGYGDGKQAFADQLLSLCQQQAMADLINTLPPEKHTLINPKDINQYFTREQSLEAIRKAAEKIISDYILTISPQLSDTQRNNLQTYIQSIA